MRFVHGLGRYEFKDGKSNKFWECLEDLDGTFLVRWGKIGAPKGQIQNQLDSWEVQQRIYEKVKKGYVHIPGSSTSLADREKRDLDSKLPESQKVVFTPPKKRL